MADKLINSVRKYNSAYFSYHEKKIMKIRGSLNMSILTFVLTPGIIQPHGICDGYCVQGPEVVLLRYEAVGENIRFSTDLGLFYHILTLIEDDQIHITVENGLIYVRDTVNTYCCPPLNPDFSLLPKEKYEVVISLPTEVLMKGMSLYKYTNTTKVGHDNEESLYMQVQTKDGSVYFSTYSGDCFHVYHAVISYPQNIDIRIRKDDAHMFLKFLNTIPDPVVELRYAYLETYETGYYRIDSTICNIQTFRQFKYYTKFWKIENTIFKKYAYCIPTTLADWSRFLDMFKGSDFNDMSIVIMTLNLVMGHIRLSLHGQPDIACIIPYAYSQSVPYVSPEFCYENTHYLRVKWIRNILKALKEHTVIYLKFNPFNDPYKKSCFLIEPAENSSPADPDTVNYYMFNPFLKPSYIHEIESKTANQENTNQ